MKSILKVLYEVLLAVITKRELGSSFKRRLKFIRCDYTTQKNIKKKLHIKCDGKDD